MQEPAKLRAAMEVLKANREYEEAYSTGTSDKEKVAKRVELATKAFADVP